jgi:hypothetical protein
MGQCRALANMVMTVLVPLNFLKFLSNWWWLLKDSSVPWNLLTANVKSQR